MKKLLFTLFLMVSAFVCADSTEPADLNAGEPMVWICDSPHAYAYHRTNKCSTLGHCTHPVICVSLSEAYEKGKDKPCQKCY